MVILEWVLKFVAKPRPMSNWRKVFWGILGLICFVIILFSLIYNTNIAVFNPKGLIAREQRELIFFALALSLIVVIPVFTLTAFIVWRYRDENPKGAYTPEWDHNTVAETVWWGVPLCLILILSIVTWTSTHHLDPFKPLVSDKKPITIQVVALEWKWLFIYPEQGIATVNYVQFPENTPINFEITADAPMNSFWIPQLGGQIYAMSGMSTKLHLIADGPGQYTGVSSNLSGRGFAGMNFIAKSSDAQEFRDWVNGVRESSNFLGIGEYDVLSRPSENTEANYFSSFENGLYTKVVMKYMTPRTTNDTAEFQMPVMMMGH